MTISHHQKKSLRVCVQKNRKPILLSSALSLLLTSTFTYADIGGTVYRDLAVGAVADALNVYGVKETNEPGVAGIKVTAFKADGTEAGTATTGADGGWSIAGTSGDVKVEFSDIPTYFESSPANTGSNTTVQFVQDGATTVDLGLHDVDDFSNTANPLYINNLQQSGSSVDNELLSLNALRYKDTGLNKNFTNANDEQGTGPVPQNIITQAQLGSVWGKAFQKDGQRLFISSMLQRHIGFVKTEADIYVVDYSTNDPSTEVLLGSFSLQGKTPANGGDDIDLGSVTRSGGSDYTLPNDPTDPSVDLDAFAKVGKISYGDIDFDQTTNTLWLVNLNQKGIISVDASGDFNSLSGATTNQYLIDSMPNLPSCTGGELRPWGLKIHQGKGYLGAVCNALTSQKADDLQAYVLSFDVNNPAAGFTQELSFHPENTPNNKRIHAWNAWSDEYLAVKDGYWVHYAEPMLTDIEFDEKNNMYIAFADRFGFQAGKGNYKPEVGATTRVEAVQTTGDLFRVCNSSGTFEIEGTGDCTATNYNNSEFFNDMAGDRHPEGSIGTLAIMKGTSEMLIGLVDPHPENDAGQSYWTTQGTNTFSTVDGSATNWYSNVRSENGGYNGKGNGMGDIELITAPAPIEIGNRIWLDANADGIQDAGEAGIADVTVQLLDNAGTVVATAITDANGNYIFSNDPNGVSTGSHKYKLSGLDDNSAYTVRIPNISGGSKQASIADYELTTANTGAGIDKDINDSDGVENGVNADAPVLATDIPFSGANNHTFDFGFTDFVASVSIGSLVWDDVNGNGIQDDGEKPLAGATITLLDENSDAVTTDVNGDAIAPIVSADGTYYFGNLPEGNYKIKVTPPAGYIKSTPQNAGDDHNATDSNIATDNADGSYTSGTIALSNNGETATDETSPIVGNGDNADNADEDNGDMSIDFAFHKPPVSIGSLIWDDINDNGIQDAGEKPLAGATITLLDASGAAVTKDIDGNPIAPIASADGTYYFGNLPEGSYKIKVTPPAGYIKSTPQNAGDDHNALDSNIATDNADGSYTSGTIALTNNGETATDETSPIANSGDDADNADEDNGDMSIDFAFHKPYVSIGSLVWDDVNGNGIQDDGEKPLAGATITLLDENGDAVTTDANGSPIKSIDSADGTYYFGNLPEGSYKIKVTPPAGYIKSTPQNAGDDHNALDSNIATDNADGSYTSGTIALTNNGETATDETSPVVGNGDNADNADEDNGDMSIDFAFHKPPVSIGSLIWDDINDNGIQDAGEKPLAGATITLLDASGAAVTKDIDGNPIAPIASADGTYYFGNLPEGSYKIKVTPPAGYIKSTPQNAGDDHNALDSNIATDNADGSYTSGTIALTNNGETATDETSPIANSGDDADNADEDNGDMSVDFAFHKPYVSIGSLVWDDTNNNGIQDEGELGIKDAVVELLDSNDQVVKTMNTDSKGLYYFDKLVPGDYKVRVTPPAGYDKSAVQNGADNDDAANDSNIASTSGTAHTSGVFTLEPDNEPTAVVETGGLAGSDDADNAAETSGNMTVDFGFFKPVENAVSIGSVVWNDTNINGIQEEGETAIAGAIVTLLDATTGEPIDGIAPVTTTSNGQYYFGNLPEGDYKVQVELADYTPTANQVTDPNSDNDNDTNIAESVGNIHTSGVVSLSNNGEPKGDAEAGVLGGEDQDASDDDNGNMTVDFGFYKPVPNAVSIGSVIWNDSNDNGKQDDGEAGIAGATVTLLDSDGKPVDGVAPIQTGSNGLYYFANLPEGDYKVKVTPPAGYEKSSKQSTADNDDTPNDSNIAISNGDDHTSALFTLTNNGEPTEEGGLAGSDDADNTDEDNGNMTVDFGFYQPVENAVSIGSVVWSDTNMDGIQDNGEPAISGATVTLLDSTGKPVANVSPQQTGSDGTYYFGNLPEGDYQIKVTPPADFVPTLVQEANADGDVDNDSNIAAVENGTDYVSGIVSLKSGEEPTEANGLSTTDDADNANETSGNMTVDFGFIPTSALGALTGNVFFDADNDGEAVDPVNPDTPDKPIEGVELQLYTTDGEPVLDPVTGLPVTTRTDENGHYGFYNLVPKDYLVKEIQPGGYASVSDIDLSDPLNDIIGDGTPISVVAGASVDNNDFVEKVDPSAIPTLSEWALLMLMMLLGFVGYRQAGTRGRGRVGF